MLQRALRLMTVVFLLVIWRSDAGAATVRSLDELIKKFDSSSCENCHSKVHQEWAKSFHGRSIVQSLGSLRTYIDALEKERKAPTDKTQMLKCLDCHAPMVNEAPENVVQEIVGLVKTAVDDASEAKKKAAREKLSKLSVNCLGCHSIKGTGNPLTAPAADVVYGSKLSNAPHRVQPSAVMQSSVFCSQCHALWYAKDGEYLYCTTIFESHQNAYRGMGGTQSCQDCHMKSGAHDFPGAHDQALVKQGLSLGLEAVGYRHLAGTNYAPRAVVTVDISNHAGHRVPDG
jgi:hypothetical protein